MRANKNFEDTGLVGHWLIATTPAACFQRFYRSVAVDGVDMVDMMDGVFQAHPRPSTLTNYEL
jgi:hypothetical protein